MIKHFDGVDTVWLTPRLCGKPHAAYAGKSSERRQAGHTVPRRARGSTTCSSNEGSKLPTRLDPRAAAGRRSRSAGKGFPCEGRLIKHGRTLLKIPQREGPYAAIRRQSCYAVERMSFRKELEGHTHPSIVKLELTTRLFDCHDDRASLVVTRNY
jgi:hypothetical protein